VKMILQGRLAPDSESAQQGLITLSPAVSSAFDFLFPIVLGILIAGIVALALAALIGQWRNLRRYPELDVMIVIGSLILPSLSPFLIQVGGELAGRMGRPVYTPMDQTPAGIVNAALYTVPMMLLGVIAGVIWGLPPRPDDSSGSQDEAEDGGVENDAKATAEVDPLAWLRAVTASRWWPIGFLYWGIFIFFFTTMFTNGAGIATGVIGSLGYWLEQHDVHRGGQPWYYYITVVLPLYEFLPLILTIVAGFIGAGLGFRWLIEPQAPSAPGDEEETPGSPEPSRGLDLDAPIAFPALAFTAYWAIMNIIGYSIAGEKMPWLGTHLTLPMILLGGWVIGRALERINWRRLFENNTWLVLILIPVAFVALMRVFGPVCAWIPAFLPCNTVIPASYQAAIFQGPALEQLSASSSWIAAVVVLLSMVAALGVFISRISFTQFTRLTGLFVVGWLTFLTARSAFTAAFINYDDATEFLVYAHSAGAVKDVLAQIEELSLRTTDGYGIQVAYDNQVSWPMSWYLRDYYNAVYYGEEPSRGLIGDAPVILAGPSNWTKVESLLGNRYYRFEHIRMWWPMQDYFGVATLADWSTRLHDLATDPALQRGLWEIFINRDYSAYAAAVTPYRPNSVPPTFELSTWPVAERMRFYVRKDVYAQVWGYGATASEASVALDPYAVAVQPLTAAREIGTGVLNHPHGMAYGPDSRLYVADTDNNRIVVFSSDGTVDKEFVELDGAPGSAGLFRQPWDVDVAPDGTVYVADTWNHRVVSFSADGEFITQWGVEGPNQFDNPFAFWGPRGITVADDGTVYVTDTGNKRIQVFDSEGAFLRQIGSGGPVEGQLDEPAGIAIGPDGRIYVADTWNQRIQVFSSDGLFINQWVIDAWFAQGTERPYLDVDQQGNVYVTDPDGYRVLVFDSIGRYLYTFGDFETLGLPGSLTLSEDGVVVVTDVDRGLIREFDTSGVSLASPNIPQ
ncbi:MAG: hypothetical protein IT326_06605, partial [Anaerolineae bacterium]|nr:hypothetical protein [Anaerolineae bacterium]